MPTRPLPASRRCAVRQDARAHITRFTECKAACRAPIRTCTELYGSARSAWVKVSPQSELMGPSSAGFRARLRLTSCHIGPSRQPLRTPGGISALALTREETCEVTSSYHTPGFCPSRGQIGGANHGTLLHSLRQFSRYSSLSAPLAGSSRLSHPTPNLAGTIMICRVALLSSAVASAYNVAPSVAATQAKRTCQSIWSVVGAVPGSGPATGCCRAH